jgi:hypothetical protein
MKKLEWELVGRDDQYDIYEAECECEFGTYIMLANDIEGAYEVKFLTWDGGSMILYDGCNVTKAKATAQYDYERRQAEANP